MTVTPTRWPGTGMLPYGYSCDEPLCTFHIGVNSPDEAPVPHKCPDTAHLTIGWNDMGKSLVAQMWEDLDTAYADFKAGNPLVNPEYSKGYMRGLAHCICKLMQPYYASSDDVVKEVLKRAKMKEAGEEYTSPGLDQITFVPPPGVADSKYSTPPPRRGSGVAKKAAAAPKEKFRALTEREKESIMLARDSFEAEDLAQMYKTTTRHILQIWENG